MRSKLGLSFILTLIFASLISIVIFSANPLSRDNTLKSRPSIATWQTDRDRDPILPNELGALTAQNLLPSGTLSLLKVPVQMRHGDFIWNDRGISAGKVDIWVDLRRQTISVFRNGHEIGTAVIIYGAEDKTSPEGVFSVIRKARDYHSRTYDAPMPSSLFITNDGVALHGSPMSARRASHGCIGLPVAFAEKLYDAASVGDTVNIIRSTGPADPYSLK